MKTTSALTPNKAGGEDGAIGLTRGGPCQHGLMCGCNFVSSGVMIGAYRIK